MAKIFVNIYWSGWPGSRVKIVGNGGKRIRQEQVHPKDKGRCPAKYGTHAYEKISYVLVEAFWVPAVVNVSQGLRPLALRSNSLNLFTLCLKR